MQDVQGKASVKQRALALYHCGWNPSMLRAQSFAEGRCALVLLLQSSFWGAGRGQELHWSHCVSADPLPNWLLPWSSFSSW